VQAGTDAVVLSLHASAQVNFCSPVFVSARFFVTVEFPGSLAPSPVPTFPLTLCPPGTYSLNTNTVGAPPCSQCSPGM